MWPRLSELLTSTPPDVRMGDVPLLRETGMAGEVASRLSPDHPLQAALKPARLALVVRNQRMRHALLPLLRAWHDAGIPALLLKGFALAHCEYATPGTRPFGDVDVLLHETDLPAALRVARTLGWPASVHPAGGLQATHEMATLFSPGQEVRLDVHRTLTRHQTRRARIRLTAQLWSASRAAVIEGVPVRVLDPRDMALHLALTRAWGGDRGFVKPADYPDIGVLIANHHLSGRDVAMRAQALGLSHTWRTYLRSCDPWHHVLRLNDAAGARRLRRAARRDGRTHTWFRVVVWLRVVVGLRTVWRLALALPDVLAVAWLLRRVHTPQQLVRHWELRRTVTPPTAARQHDLIRGVYWWTRWLYPRSQGDCVPKALATHRALTRRGYPAVFVSGVRRTATGHVEGHAWVEGPQGALATYESAGNRQRYRVLFEYRPPEPSSAPD